MVDRFSGSPDVPKDLLKVVEALTAENIDYATVFRRIDELKQKKADILKRRRSIIEAFQGDRFDILRSYINLAISGDEILKRLTPEQREIVLSRLWYAKETDLEIFGRYDHETLKRKFNTIFRQSDIATTNFFVALGNEEIRLYKHDSYYQVLYNLYALSMAGIEVSIDDLARFAERENLTGIDSEIKNLKAEIGFGKRPEVDLSDFPDLEGQFIVLIQSKQADGTLYNVWRDQGILLPAECTDVVRKSIKSRFLSWVTGITKKNTEADNVSSDTDISGDVIQLYEELSRILVCYDYGVLLFEKSKSKNDKLSGLALMRYASENFDRIHSHCILLESRARAGDVIPLVERASFVSPGSTLFEDVARYFAALEEVDGITSNGAQALDEFDRKLALPVPAD